MRSKNTFVIIVVAIIATTVLSDFLTKTISMNDHCGISIGTSLEDCIAAVPDEELFVVSNYGFFVNDMGYPVGLKFDQNGVTEITVFDLAKINSKPSSFESLKPGMSLFQVARTVGIPSGVASGEGFPLYHYCSDGYYYIVNYEEVDGILQFVSAVPDQTTE